MRHFHPIPCAVAAMILVFAARGVRAPLPGTRIQQKAAELERQPASAYAWCDMAEAYADGGGEDKARYCWTRAAALGPNLAAVWVRRANYHLLENDVESAVLCWSRALGLTDKYDQMVFSTVDRIVDRDDLLWEKLIANELVRVRCKKYRAIGPTPARS